MRHRLRARGEARETYIAVDPSGPSLQQQYYTAHGPPTATFLGAGWAAVLLVCTTLMCLASAATAFLLVLRPSLRVRSTPHQQGSCKYTDLQPQMVLSYYDE